MSKEETASEFKARLIESLYALKSHNELKNNGPGFILIDWMADGCLSFVRDFHIEGEKPSEAQREPE